MEYKEFHYKLVSIYQAPPQVATNTPNTPFLFDYRIDQQPNGANLVVSSQTFVNLQGPKVFGGESVFFLPAEQPTPNVGDLAFSELIYQHLARQTDMVYASSQGEIILTIPTIKSILENMVVGEN